MLNPHRRRWSRARWYIANERALATIAIAAQLACSPPAPTVPKPSPIVIDRFSAAAGHLLRRDGRALPGPDVAIDFDQPPFITYGLGPDGRVVHYYNFDVQSPTPATRYRFTRPGQRTAIAKDLIDVIPGEHGYSDFWRIVWVEVPEGTAPITSTAQLAGLRLEASNQFVTCPVVPRGSTAREGSVRHVEVWYRNTLVSCLELGGPLELVHDQVPTSPIYVTFAREPALATEPATPQTHNVVGSLPGDPDYSPLWDVHVYARASFADVHDLGTARAAPPAGKGPLVNCPIVFAGPAP